MKMKLMCAAVALFAVATIGHAQDFVVFKDIACATNATATINTPNANPSDGLAEVYHGWLSTVVLEVSGGTAPTGTVEVATAASRYTGARRVLFTTTVTSAGLVTNLATRPAVFAPLRLETKSFNETNVTVTAYTVMSPLP